MSDFKAGSIKVRNMDFQFTHEPAYYWNPQNMHWGNIVNFITMIAPAFERYFIKATRQAMPLIKDARVKHEADLFCLQEAQHSKQHLAHLAVLIKQHPGLEETRKQVMDSYEMLFKNRPIEFHLSYAATIELCFGPIASFVIEHRDALFKGGDPRIASFMLWHFIEEFEHRNCAIDIYKDVVGSHGYRLKTAPAVVQHIRAIEKITREGFNRHVPVSEQGCGPADVDAMFKGVTLTSQLGLLYNLLCTLLPYHKPDNIKQPEWAAQWFVDEAAGMDMTLYYS
jgi:predicted metal-dependent hydrolase